MGAELIFHDYGLFGGSRGPEKRGICLRIWRREVGVMASPRVALTLESPQLTSALKRKNYFRVSRAQKLRYLLLQSGLRAP